MEIIDLKELKKEQKRYINILVSRKYVVWVASNFKITEHAQFRFVQRDTQVSRDLKSCIMNSPLAWKNLNGTICIALNLYDYIVVDVLDGVPIIKTFASTKEYDSSVVDKMFVEYKRFIAESKGEKNV